MFQELVLLLSSADNTQIIKPIMFGPLDGGNFFLQIKRTQQTRFPRNDIYSDSAGQLWHMYGNDPPGKSSIHG